MQKFLQETLENWLVVEFRTNEFMAKKMSKFIKYYLNLHDKSMNNFIQSVLFNEIVKIIWKLFEYM